MTRLRWMLWRARHREDIRKLRETEAELERVRGQWPDVHEIVEVLTRHRQRNHFSESIANIYRGGH